MRRIQTSALLTLSVFFFVLSGMLQVGVTCIRPVKDATGEQVFRPDGRRLMETDTWGNIKLQWPSEIPLLVSLVLFGWSIARLIRWFHRRPHP